MPGSGGLHWFAIGTLGAGWGSYGTPGWAALVEWLELKWAWAQGDPGWEQEIKWAWASLSCGACCRGALVGQLELK